MNYIVKEALYILKQPRNVGRLPNAAKTILAFLFSKMTGRAFVWGYPFMLMLEPTNVCNLRCPLCITGSKLMTRPNGFMSFDQFKALIDEMDRYLVHLTLWSQGEPFVNDEFLEMVRYAASKGIKTMTSTNGHFLTDRAEQVVQSGLDTLIVAVDGASQETYERYRVNGKFQKVYSGMTAVRDAKKRLNSTRPSVELQFIVMKHNEHELDSIRTLAHECGADVLSFKTAQVYTKEQADEFLPTVEKYRRYALGPNGELKTKEREVNFCRWVLLCPVINWDGTVSPCCFDKNADYGLGNVFTNGGLKSVWRDRPYREFRSRVFTRRKSIPICSNCSEGLEVEVFEKEFVQA